MPPNYSAVTVNIPNGYYTGHLVAMAIIHAKFPGAKVRQGAYIDISVYCEVHTVESLAVKKWVADNLSL